MAAHTQKAILLGAGGHAKVVCAMARALGYEILAVTAPELSEDMWRGISALSCEDDLSTYDPAKVVLLNGIGKLPNGTVRNAVQMRWQERGYAFPSLIHPHSWIAEDVELSAGVQVMAGAVVQPGVSLGAGTIVNTNASVDHDCTIGADVHIAPGATLCGAVDVGDGAVIGAGAVIIQSVRIGKLATVAAGAVLVRDLAPHKLGFGQKAASCGGSKT